MDLPVSWKLKINLAFVYLKVFTVTAWIYIDGPTQDLRIVDKNTAGKIDGYGLDVFFKNDRSFLRLCAAGGCWTGLKPLLSQTWYHVAAVFCSTAASEKLKSPAGIFFFVNGESDYEIPFPVPMYGIGSAQRNSVPLRIGRAGSGGAYWKGMIDDVSIWDIPLTRIQIRRLMFERLGGKERGLVGYWSFNEGAGSTTIDHSSSRRDATVYYAKWVPSEKKDMVLNDCV